MDRSNAHRTEASHLLQHAENQGECMAGDVEMGSVGQTRSGSPREWAEEHEGMEESGEQRDMNLGSVEVRLQVVMIR